MTAPGPAADRAPAISAEAAVTGVDEVIDVRFKGFAPAAFGRSLHELAAARPSLFDGTFVPPIMVLKDDALRHNVETMAHWAIDRGVEIAPHGKTTLAPKIFRLQLASGAWGISVGTLSQVALCRAFGIQRVLLANEIVDATGIDWILRGLDADPGFEFMCYIDSLEGVEMLAGRLDRRGPGRRPAVLVEIGPVGGRTGCRTIVEAVRVARAAHAAGLSVVGIAGYEGAIGHEINPSVLSHVRAFLSLMRAAADAVVTEGLLDASGEVILSAGGSVFFDEVAESFTKPLADGTPTRTIIRPGAYASHDSGLYERLSPFTRPGAAPGHRLEPALEAWGHILSTPEPGLALADVGRRDVPFDQGLPVPLRLRRPANGQWLDAAGMEVFDLNDQHAFVRVPQGRDAKVGDWIVFGISHPCTAFDKWHLLPVVDGEYRVVDFVRTYF